MESISIESLTFQDLTRPEIMADPYVLFRRLRLEAPVHEDPAGRGWMVTRYDDIAMILSSSSFSAERLISSNEVDGAVNAVRSAMERQMLFLDPPDHTRLRKLFAKAFTPRRLESLRTRILEIASNLLDRAEKIGEHIDFIREFAAPFPFAVISQMLGVPDQDQPRLRVWSSALDGLISGRMLSAMESEGAERGIQAFIEYFKKMINERKHKPGSDMLSDLISVEERGDFLGEGELIMNLILLLSAGHITTTHLLGNGMLALLNNPAQWKMLTSEKSMMLTAVNELLRFDAPVQATSREALQDVRIGDKVIREGQHVTLFLGSANRDPAYFKDPDALDLRRSGARILSFGHGIHTCLGSVLAKMEAQIAFSELARRYPSIRIEADVLRRVPSISLRGLQHLSVALV